jgi:transposase
VCVPRFAATGDNSQKKSLRYAEQLDPEVQRERKAWRKRINGVNPQRFKFLDQSNAKTNMIRLYGRAPRGKRAVDYVPDGRWESLTMVAALGHDGKTIPMVYEGGTDVLAMQTFVECWLVPALKPGDIVAMDNLSSHHHPEVVSAIEVTGAEVWFLPRYSPDYNPIEQMWSKVKSQLRKAAARSKKHLIRAIGQALKTVTTQDAAGWFACAGYQ